MEHEQFDVRDDLYAWMIGELRKHRTRRVVEWNEVLCAYCNEHGESADILRQTIEQLPSTNVEAGAALDVYEAIRRVEREGIVTILPKLSSGGFVEMTPKSLAITPHGRRALAHEQLSPANPSFTQRLRKRVADLDASAVARFEDAAMCLAVPLVRPCAVMLGVAYEDVVAQLCHELGHMMQQTPQKLREHKQRLDALHELFEQRKSEVPRAKQESLSHTFAVAEQLRRARNDAAHFGPAETELARVRSLFESAIWVLEEWWVFRGALR